MYSANKYYMIYYIIIASVARRVYMRCPSGVGALSRRYGGKNERRGCRPSRTATGSKKIIRYCLKQYETMGWMRKAEKGRKLTKKGQQFMDDFVDRIKKSRMVYEYNKRKNGELKKKDDYDGSTAGMDDDDDDNDDDDDDDDMDDDDAKDDADLYDETPGGIDSHE